MGRGEGGREDGVGISVCGKTKGVSSGGNVWRVWKARLGRVYYSKEEIRP